MKRKDNQFDIGSNGLWYRRRILCMVHKPGKSEQCVYSRKLKIEANEK